MGCNCTREPKPNVISRRKSLGGRSSQTSFKVSISVSQNSTVSVLPMEGEKEYMLLSELLNQAVFAKQDFNANFTARYDPLSCSFKYSIQRINHLEVDEEQPSKEWRMYINDKYKDFTHAVQEGLIVHVSDDVNLKYE